jgi:hypothetical protein
MDTRCSDLKPLGGGGGGGLSMRSGVGDIYLPSYMNLKKYWEPQWSPEFMNI